MDFHRYVRENLPALTIRREPEIVDELAQHLAELYREARASGLEHAEALAQATAALPKDADGFARDIESASRTLPDLIADRWRDHDAAPLPSSVGVAPDSLHGPAARRPPLDPHARAHAGVHPRPDADPGARYWCERRHLHRGRRGLAPACAGRSSRDAGQHLYRCVKWARPILELVVPRLCGPARQRGRCRPRRLHFDRARPR